MSSTLGSPTSTRWKRRDERAVALEVLPVLLERRRADAAQAPDASAGLSRFDASMLPPLVAPAPMIVWISSMKRMAPSAFCERLDDAP